jgi:hypothetical protein
MKKIGVMQPYFLPYVGYFQLIYMVDEFVLYDNIEFTKKGWINRNRMLQNGKSEYFTLPLRKGSDYLDVSQRFLADTSEIELSKILRRITANYRKAPFFRDFYPVLEDVFLSKKKNLFEFIYQSIQSVLNYLDIETSIIVSSDLSNEISFLKKEKKVLEICKALNASSYINPSSGKDLYNKNEFKVENINLEFCKTKSIKYTQFKNDFIEHLSIIDVCMFNDKQTVKSFLKDFDVFC